MSNNNSQIQRVGGEIVPAGAREGCIIPAPLPDARFLIAVPGQASAEKWDDIIERDINTFIRSKEQRSRETGRHYRSHIDLFRSFLRTRYDLHRPGDLVSIDPTPPMEHLVTEAHVLEFRQFLLYEHEPICGPTGLPTGQRGVKPGTVNDYIKALRGLYRYFKAKKRTVFSPADNDLVPTLRTPEMGDGVTQELTEEAAIRVFNHPDNQPRTLRLRRARAILLVLLEIGARESELTQWTRRRFEQLTDEDGNVFWTVKFVQKLSRMRHARLSDVTMNALTEMWDIMGFRGTDDHAAFPSIGRRNFGMPIKNGSISDDVDMLLQNAALGHLTTHSTRVGAINRLLDNGGNPIDIAKIVGMSLQMVQRYTRRNLERKSMGNLCVAGMEGIHAEIARTDFAAATLATVGRAPGEAYRNRQRDEIVDALCNTRTKTAASKHLGYSREWLRKKIKEYAIKDAEWKTS